MEAFRLYADIALSLSPDGGRRGSDSYLIGVSPPNRPVFPPLPGFRWPEPWPAPFGVAGLAGSVEPPGLSFDVSPPRSVAPGGMGAVPGGVRGM